MTPEERQMVERLFDRLASLEYAERDPQAMRAISDGLQRAPNALYPLVQTVLVQDEALRRADARIRELKYELGMAPEQGEPSRGFLDSMRDAPHRRGEPQGSVPTVRPGAAAPMSDAWRTTRLPQGNGPPPQDTGPGGGSFLGNAAAVAVGVVGGTLLMNGLRGLFGGQHGQAQAASDPRANPASPWGAGDGGDLARQAGIGDIGHGGAASTGGVQRAGLFDTAANAADDDSDGGADDDFGSADDFDFDDGDPM